MHDNKFEELIIYFGYTAQLTAVFLGVITDPYLLIVWISGFAWVTYAKMRIKENNANEKR